MKSVEIYKIKMFKESSIEYGSISCASEGAEILSKLMEDEAEEHFWILTLDCKGKVTGAFEVGHGSLSSCEVHPRSVFQRALISNASSIVLGHCHPSGISSPSSEDIALTKRLVECGKLMGIRVLDHIIVGDGNYTSLMAEGLL